MKNIQFNWIQFNWAVALAKHHKKVLKFSKTSMRNQECNKKKSKIFRSHQ